MALVGGRSNMWCPARLQVGLESKFGQKVKERGSRAVVTLHREVMKVAGGELDAVPLKVLEGLLFPWGLSLDGHDRAVMLHRYMASSGTPFSCQLGHLTTCHSACFRR